MHSHFTWLAAAACLIASGCGSSKQSATAPAEPTANASKGEAADSAATPVVSPAPVERPKTEVKAVESSEPLRQLAARLIESNGVGGWRINDKSATELEKLGPESTERLWTLLNDQQVEVRRGAAFYLLSQLDDNQPQQVAAFTMLVEDSDRTIRNIGLSAVQQMSKEHQAAAVPRLTSLLDPAREDKADNRAAVARICGSIKRDATAALPALTAAATRDGDAKVRAAALAAISQIAEPEQAVSALRVGLSDSESSVRLVAAARLRQLGRAATPAARDLANVLSDADSSAAENAAEALIRIGQPAVEPLVAQLSARSVTARKLALACLAKLGPLAKPAAGEIEKCKNDSDSEIRKLAEAALARIGAKK